MRIVTKLLLITMVISYAFSYEAILKSVDGMKGELEKYPNNAFKLKVSKEKLLGALALLTLKNKRNDDE